MKHYKVTLSYKDTFGDEMMAEYIVMAKSITKAEAMAEAQLDVFPCQECDHHIKVITSCILPDAYCINSWEVSSD